MRRAAFLGFFLPVLSYLPSYADCSWTTLQNGSTADANQVMNNFDCLAPLANPHFTGSVGIGTSSPDANLVITNADISTLKLNVTNAPSTYYTSLINRWDASQPFTIYNGEGSGQIFGLKNAFGGDGNPTTYLSNYYNVALATGSATPNASNIRLFIDGVGNVGIGTTSPDNPLTVEAPTGVSHLLALDRVDGGRIVLFDGSNGDLNILPTSNVGIGTIHPSYTLEVNGSVAGTSAYVNLSDVRLKKNIAEIRDALDMVKRIRGVRFSWKRAGERSIGKELNLPVGRPQIGFIAQELKGVLPEAVSTADDKDRTMSVSESKVVPVLVEAIKELIRANRKLEAETTGLRKRVTHLEHTKMLQSAAK